MSELPRHWGQILVMKKLGKFELLMLPLCQPARFLVFVSDVGFAEPQLTDAFPTAFNSRKTCPELPNSFQSEHLFLKEQNNPDI